MNPTPLSTAPINTILLAEDDREHCFFFKRALLQVNSKIQYNEVNDGETLMKFLENFLPDLLFLDLHMPCKNGVDCLREIRANRAYDKLPIVIFTISNQHDAVQTIYGLGASLYFVKPGEYTQLAGSLEKILSMDWRDPSAVAKQHFRESKFVAFEN
jgi:DNA-binding response OmpR family regulator